MAKVAVVAVRKVELPLDVPRHEGSVSQCIDGGQFECAHSFFSSAGRPLQSYEARKFGPWLDEARDPLMPGVLQELVEPVLGDAEDVDAESIMIKDEWWVQHCPLDECCLLQYLAIGAGEALAIIIPHEALPEV